MGPIFFFIVIGTSIWVGLDASAIGVRRGQGTGLGDMGAGGWFLACLLLWIVAFPLYLTRRGRYQALNGLRSGGPSTGIPLKTAAPGAPDPIDQLRRLSELRESGALTDDEYNATKVELLRLIA